MAAWSDLGNIWKTFKELDTRPLAEEAERPIVLAFVGADSVGKSTLIAALRHDKRSREKVISPTIEADLDAALRLGLVDLVVLMLDATRDDFTAEADLYREWKSAGRNVIVFYNKMDAVADTSQINSTLMPWSGARIAFGSALDYDSLAMQFIPRALEALPERHAALARRYPIFRLPVAHKLIAETSSANATYSIGTGIAEIVPALNIPFNVADTIVLTKNQALMVYKLGLVLGLSTDWRDHAAELGGVVGAGFMWRQLARQLIGLIPAWGIIPKVAIAYAGTYAVGEAILRWYQTGHKVSGQGMKEIYADALARGKQVAQSLIARAPRPALPSRPRLALPKPRGKMCPNCGKKNARDAVYCAYCSTKLDAIANG
ncbi:MAG: zinc-ribbon domain-containing protein [Chloroflexi bacterium]|nr:zinc-ribbon domain-containing protein [Chloroflexota bacterium]